MKMKRLYIIFDLIENYFILNLVCIFYYCDCRVLRREEIIGVKCCGRVGVLGELFGIIFILIYFLYLIYSGGKFK